jgi:hypothetical protein
VNVELEKEDKDTLQKTAEADKKFLAQVIKQHFATNTNFSFGKSKKIGGYEWVAIMPLTTVAPSGPAYTDLKETWMANKPEFTKVRADVARVLGILDKGHTHHGSNFSGTQSLEQIIRNLVSKVEGPAEIMRVTNLVKTKYKLTL